MRHGGRAIIVCKFQSHGHPGFPGHPDHAAWVASLDLCPLHGRLMSYSRNLIRPSRWET